MIATPKIPAISGFGLSEIFGNTLPVRVELSPLALAVLVMMAGIFIATVSVVLVYHWRRFPFEYELFRWIERIYLVGVVVLLTVVVFGIFLS